MRDFAPLATEPADEWWSEHYVDDEEFEAEERRQEDYDRYLAGSAFTMPKHLFWQPNAPKWTRLVFQPSKQQRVQQIQPFIPIKPPHDELIENDYIDAHKKIAKKRNTNDHE